MRKGDTLIRVGLETGQNWKDIAAWNNLDNPNAIDVGQVLRIAAPVAASPAVVAHDRGVVARPVPSSSSGITPVQVPPVASAGSPETSGAGPIKTAPPVVAAPPRNDSANSSASDDEPKFMWPAAGSLLAGFDEQRNKGLDIGGRPGEAVVAAADGRVVYSGAGLRGYGNLIILKHNNTYLTAYAHNQTLLVKEDQSVKKGQKIAEMGNSDSDRVKLHFEIRKQGKPVDPSKYLPAR